MRWQIRKLRRERRRKWRDRGGETLWEKFVVHTLAIIILVVLIGIGVLGRYLDYKLFWWAGE
jgi:hypothetical protein